MKVKYFVALTIVLPQIIVVALFSAGMIFPPYRDAFNLLSAFGVIGDIIIIALMLRLIGDKDLMERDMEDVRSSPPK
jgi:hypothetical protein